MHDPRVGRFFSPDPLEGKFPWLSTYQFSGNRVIDATELEGREIDFVVWDPSNGGKNQTQSIHTIEEISREMPINLLTDLFGWTITQTVNLKDIGITWTFINYDSSWRLVPDDKINGSLYNITKAEWESFKTPEDINSFVESIEGLGQRMETAVNFVQLGDGIRNLYKGFRGLRKNKAIRKSFTKAENKAIDEAMDVLNSDKFDELTTAMKNNKAATVEINGRSIQFEPDIPESSGISAMTLDDGFVLSKRAFSSTEELAKTVFQEIHRLNFSEVVRTGSVNAKTATETTNNAFEFAEKAFKVLSGSN